MDPEPVHVARNLTACSPYVLTVVSSFCPCVLRGLAFLTQLSIRIVTALSFYSPHVLTALLPNTLFAELTLTVYSQ